MKIFIPFYLHKQKNRSAVSDVFTYVIDHYDGDKFIFSALGDYQEDTYNRKVFNNDYKFFRLIKKMWFFLVTDTIWTIQGDRFSFFVSKIFRKKLIVSFHADYITLKQNCLEKKIKSFGYCKFGIFKLLQNADIIIPSSKYGEACLSREYKRNIQYVYNGVDFDFFNKKNNHKHDFTVCFVGRYIESKRADLILKLAERLPKIKFIMAGGDYDSSYLTNLNIPSNVTSIGWVNREKIRELYQISDVMLFPSISEGFGLVILEANACGLPVIASNIPVFSEIIQNENGTLIDLDENEIDNYIIAIRKYQEYIPDTRKYILGKKDFVWKNVSKNYIKILEKLI